MRSRKKFPVRYIIYMALFLASAVITFFSMGHEAEVAATMIMTGARLPVVMVSSAQGNDYNIMHGYVSDIDETGLEKTITPLPADNKLTLAIDTYGETVNAISYKVRDSRDMTLIENTEVEKYSTEGNRVVAELKIRNLIIDDVYYILEITLKTNSFEDVKYYTTIVGGEDYDIDSKINFVKEFNSNVYDAVNINKIAEHIEPDSTADNTNFGRVNIHNSQSVIGFGDMNPFVESDIIPSVYELDEETAVIAFDYVIGAENEFDSYDTFVVHEFYRIRQTTRGIYLLSFDRQTTQLFDGVNDATTSGKIDFGIQPDSDIEYLSDNDNNQIFFVIANVLWRYDVKKNTFTRVFGFDSAESDNIRERYASHEIKIIDVEDNGNAYFMVYGYMNRGAHEGETGVALYHYSSHDNRAAEKIFIPINASFSKMKDCIGEVAYVNNDNAFTIMIDNNLYSIELTSKEVMTEVSGLKQVSYVTSADNKLIAYVSGEAGTASSTLRVLNVKNGTDYIIKADENELVRPLGFIGTDFIYGIINKSDIYYTENGEQIYPAYELKVINSNYELIKEYSLDNSYVTDVKVDGLRVILSRVRKADDGYATISDDQLINKDENDTDSRTHMDTMLSNIRKIQRVLVIPETYIELGNIAVTDAGTEYVKNNTISYNEIFRGEGRYYVTGMGLAQGSYKNISEAVNAADASYGTVYDSDGTVIWKKFKKSVYSNSLSRFYSDNGGSLASARSTVSEYLGAKDGQKSVIVRGIDLKNLLTVVGMQRPLIAKGYGGYILITGYSTTEVEYIDASSGATYKAGITELQNELRECGNAYEIYYKD